MDQQIGTPSAPQVTPPLPHHVDSHKRRVMIFIIVIVILLVGGYFAYQQYLKYNARPLTPEEQKAAVINHLETMQVDIPQEQKNQIILQLEAQNKAAAAARAQATGNVSEQDKQDVINNLGQ